MANVENLDTLVKLAEVYKSLVRIKKEETLRVEIKLPSGTILLPKDMYEDIKNVCLSKLNDLTEEIEKL